jgi:spermidine synthase
MARRSAILAAAFVLGAYALCAQAVLLREAQVLLFGSELSWGLVLAFWLAGIAVGAQAAGWALGKSGRPWILFAVAALLVPAVLVGEVSLLRLARSWLGVGPGEYVWPESMLWISALATMPIGLLVGATFPAVSALAARDDATAGQKARAVGSVYLWEAAGSLAGGLLFSFVLVGRVDVIVLAVAGGALVALAVAMSGRACGRTRWSVIVPGAAAVVAVGLVVSGGARAFDGMTQLERWESFSGGQLLLASKDTPYQNLAVGTGGGHENSLYSNGLRVASWPNPREFAVAAHLAACECPAPRRILVLGGGAEGLLKELLRYNPERLDYVTLDPATIELLWNLPQEDQEAINRLGDHIHFGDIRRFVRQAAARDDRYDLIVLAAPEPASTLEARLYTLEFFEQVSTILSDDGVLALALRAPVGYWSPEPAAYVGSVVGPLRGIFPDVLMTFDDPTRIFAAKRAGVLTADGMDLALRYRRAGVQSPWFDPLWFMGATDSLDADKRATTDQALHRYPPQFWNTDEQPAAALYHMRYWMQMTEAVHAGDKAARMRTDILGLLMGLRLEWVLLAGGAATVLAAGWGAAGGRRGLRQAALLWSVGTTGFATMALEIVLLYTFQTLYGYVYSMVGLVIGVFMAGLVMGSLAMNRRLRRVEAAGGPMPGLRSLFAIDLAVLIFAAALVLVLAVLRIWAVEWAVQVATFALVALAGVLGGLVFPLGAAVALESRPSTARAAGVIDAADSAGACLGALVTGVLLVPILGTSGACMAVAGVKVASALLTGAATAVSAAEPKL